MGTSPTHPSLPGLGQRGGTALLRLLADAVPVLLAYYEVPGLRCVFANQRYAQYSGMAVDALIGKTVRDAVGERAWQQILPYVERALQGETVQYTREHVQDDGEARMMEITLMPHLDRDGDGQPHMVGAFVLINDITHHWAAERAVRQSEERMRKFAEATEEGIVFHREGIILDGNEALQRLTGYPLDELVGHPIIDFVEPAHHEAVREYVQHGREDPYELAIRHKDGHTIQIEAVGKTMPQAGGAYRVVVARDITARKQAQARADFLAGHDTLTQLPNRRSLMQQLARTLADAQHWRRRAAVLFIDLDHFKTVNESLGHEAGDQLLCEMARRLQGSVEAGDFVARVGGDQFVAVLPDIRNRTAAATLADTLLERVRAVYAIDGTPLSLSPSIGISVFPEDGYAPDELLRRADAAMHRAKESGRGTRQFYAPGMEGQPTEILQLEHQLREAVFQEAFVLHYQPQVEVSSGRLVGFEALVRWQHPQRGLIGPDEFLPVAESRGLITPIGRWVLREACRQVKAWHDEGLPRVPVAVNLSPLEFRQRDVAAEIAAVLHATGLEPRYLEIEITESALMWHTDQTRETLQALQHLGVGVAVDDFGTGYSSLAYLKRYPLDKLKIDRSFLTEAPANGDDVAIVTAIVQLAHSLQLQPVAEGVETAEQIDLLRRLGCGLAQGFGISQPMDAERTRAWLQALPA
jgi:diguanylate cyclase (GGDEF)-like protein/PAS domain S-box-containing protein